MLLAFWALAPMAFAQGSKLVNSIKRNSQYLYAEATMDTVNDAYDVAKELLINNIKEYASDKKAFRDKDILVRDIASHCDSIQLRRGEMYKVFLYVNKDNILEVEDNVTLIGERPAEPVVLPKDNTVVSETASMHEEVPVQKQEPVEKAPERDSSLDLSIPWQQDVIDRLLAAPSYEQAKAMVSRFRAESKIKRAGPEETCRDRSASFWLVGYNGEVVTVLGPGSGERTDFNNQTKSTLEYYSGLDLYWFTLAK